MADVFAPESGGPYTCPRCGHQSLDDARAAYEVGTRVRGEHHPPTEPV